VSPNVSASVKARLLTRAKKQEVEFELFLVRYACERFLYRLGASELRERLVLKGAGLLALWMEDPYRSTRDVDVLAFGDNDAAAVRIAMETICRVPCPEDGLRFDLDSLEITPIRAEDEYPGQRAVLRAYLGTAKIRIQVDFGFGDAITPGPVDAECPVLLPGMSAPKLRTYPRVVTVAEKFEAMVHLGRTNSRMKDFHDIWALSGAFAFEGALLRQAIAKCFERRRRPWTSEIPEALGSSLYSDPNLQERWRAYLRASAFRTAPPGAFEVIGERIRDFLLPVRDSIVAATSFDRAWPAGGPWR
jgi:hypothetical protein